MSIYSGPEITNTNLAVTLDAANPKSFSPNVMPNPLDIFGWCGGAGLNNCVISRDTNCPAGPSPAGGTPLRMFITGNDPHIGCYNSTFWNLANASIGQTWAISAYVASSQPTTGELFLFGAASTGSVFSANTYISAGAFNSTTSWSRVSFTTTIPATATETRDIQCRLDGANSGGANVIIWWDGLQVERVSSPTTFNPRPNANTSNWIDIDGGNNNGTAVNSPRFVATNQGTLVFETGNQYINLVNNSSLQVGNTFSVNCWINPSNLSSRHGLFSTRLANETGSWQLEIGTGSSGTNRVAVTGVGTWIWESNNNAISANNWVNICYVRTDNTSPGSMYVNGTALTPFQTTAYTILNNSSDKRIAQGTSNGSPFFGSIPYMQLYNIPLTPQQVQLNFQALRSRFGI